MKKPLTWLLALIVVWMFLRTFGHSLQTAVGNLGEIITPRSGQHVLGEEVLGIVTHLRRLNTNTFALGQKLSGFQTQRTVEGAWPIRLEESAKVLVWHREEGVPPIPCQEAGISGDLRVYDCR